MLDKILLDAGLEPGKLRDSLATRKTTEAAGLKIATADIARYVAWLREQRTGSQAPSSVRESIARQAEAFHSQAGTLTPAVGAAIARLRAGAPLLKIAHQPNSFVTQNIAVMSHVHQVTRSELESKAGLRPVPLFILIDYDVAGDTRFRSAILPSNGRQPARLRGAVATRDHDRLAFAAKRPSPTQLDQWRAALRNAMLLLARQLARVTELSIVAARQRFETLLTDLDTSWGSAGTLVEWNAFALSRIVNSRWAHDTVFVPASAMVLELASEIGETLDSLAETVSAATLVWRTCPKCFTRCPCEPGDERDRWAVAVCPECDFRAAERIDFSKSCRGPWGQDLPVFVPRVYLCDTMDLAVYDFAAGITYAGGLDHTVAARIAFARRGKELPPELVWEPTNLLFDGTPAYSEMSPNVMTDLQRGRYPSLLYSALRADFLKSLEFPHFAAFPVTKAKR